MSQVSSSLTTKSPVSQFEEVPPNIIEDNKIYRSAFQITTNGETVMAPGIKENKENVHTVVHFDGVAPELEPSPDINAAAKELEQNNIPESPNKTEEYKSHKKLTKLKINNLRVRLAKKLLPKKNSVGRSMVSEEAENSSNKTLVSSEIEMPILQPLNEDTEKNKLPLEAMPDLQPVILHSTSLEESNVDDSFNEQKEKIPELSQDNKIVGASIISSSLESPIKSEYYNLPVDENLIMPTKTKDVTKIKGWRNKNFTPLKRCESEASTPQVSQNDIKSLNTDSCEAFSSGMLEEFLQREATLNISLLAAYNPNITPLNDDSPILRMGPFCNNLELEASTSTSNNEIIRNESELTTPEIITVGEKISPEYKKPSIIRLTKFSPSNVEEYDKPLIESLNVTQREEERSNLSLDNSLSSCSTTPTTYKKRGRPMKNVNKIPKFGLKKILPKRGRPTKIEESFNKTITSYRKPSPKRIPRKTIKTMLETSDDSEATEEEKIYSAEIDAGSYLLCQGMEKVGNLIKDDFDSKPLDVRNSITDFISNLNQSKSQHNVKKPIPLSKMMDQRFVKFATEAVRMKQQPSKKKRATSPVKSSTAHQENAPQTKRLKRALRLPARFLDTNIATNLPRKKLKTNKNDKDKSSLPANNESLEHYTDPSLLSNNNILTSLPHQESIPHPASPIYTAEMIERALGKSVDHEEAEHDEVTIIDVIDKETRSANAPVIDISSDEEEENQNEDRMSEIQEKLIKFIPDLLNFNDRKRTDRVITMHIKSLKRSNSLLYQKLNIENGLRRSLTEEVNKLLLEVQSTSLQVGKTKSSSANGIKVEKSESTLSTAPQIAPKPNNISILPKSVSYLISKNGNNTKYCPKILQRTLRPNSFRPALRTPGKQSSVTYTFGNSSVGCLRPLIIKTPPQRLAGPKSLVLPYNMNTPEAVSPSTSSDTSFNSASLVQEKEPEPDKPENEVLDLDSNSINDDEMNEEEWIDDEGVKCIIKRLDSDDDEDEEMS